MANKDIQNDYRAERKKRLAKNAKKNKKSSVDSVKLVTWIVRLITIAVVISLTAFGLYQFGVPQKFMPAVKVGDRTYSVAEYGYYYSSVFQSYAEQANTMYQTYGFSTFDASKDPSLQTTTDEDGKTITYDELFRDSVITTLETTNYYLAKCEEEGITLSEEHQQEIDSLISDLSETASNASYSLTRYISLIYGKGMNEKLFTELLTEQYLVAQYVENIESECYDSISTEDLEKAYEEDSAEFQSVDIRLFGFDVDDKDETEETTTSTETTTDAENTTIAEDTTVAEETSIAEETTVSEETTAAEESSSEEKAPTKTELLAQEMCDKVTDEDSFMKLAYEYAAEEDKETFKDGTATLAKNIKKSIVESQIGEDLAEWLYSEEREIGDKKVYSTDEYVYVIYIIKTAYRIEEPLVDARHILIGFDDVAAELKKAEDNKIDTEKKDDVKVETATTEDEKEITNEGTGYSIELVTETYKRAYDVYEEYMKGEKTEESFAKLADSHSSDAASSTEGANGGLYESIERGKMVEPFENWVYDESRKAGDVDVIMTEYGWHVMYFVKHHEEPAWMVSARTTLGSAAFAEIEAETEEAVAGTATEATFIKFAGNEACKTADRLYG